MIQYTFPEQSAVIHTVKTWKFPAGEVGVALTCGNIHRNDVWVEASMRNSDELIEFCMFIDAIRRKYWDIRIVARFPYLPYARQDRVCHDGEALSIAVIANIINGLNLNSVILVDPHSDVSPALFKNSSILGMRDVWKSLYKCSCPSDNNVVVAPDAGAYKKACMMAEYMGVERVVVANKSRGEGGKIVSHTLSENVDGCNVFVFDDIVDGGQTFINLASLLVGAKRKYLYVTHGIFTKGTKHVTQHYDNVYTTNSYHVDLEPVDETDRLYVSPLFFNKC